MVEMVIMTKGSTMLTKVLVSGPGLRDLRGVGNGGGSDASCSSVATCAYELLSELAQMKEYSCPKRKGFDSGGEKARRLLPCARVNCGRIRNFDHPKRAQGAWTVCPEAALVTLFSLVDILWWIEPSGVV